MSDSEWLGRLGSRPDLSVLEPEQRRILENAEANGARWRHRSDRHNEWRLHEDGGDGAMIAYATARLTHVSILNRTVVNAVAEAAK
jgi:hypothetical protein